MRIVKPDHKLADKARRAKEKKQAQQFKQERALESFRRSRAFPYVKEMINNLIKDCFLENTLDDEIKIAKATDDEIRHLMIGNVVAKKKLHKLLKDLTS